MLPDRLYGVWCHPTYEIDHGVAELERCRKAGLPGALVWQAPPPELSFATKHYERLWAAAPGSGGADQPPHPHRPALSLAAPDGPKRPTPSLRTMRSAVNNKLLYASNAMSDLIMTGVLERYPRLKFVLVENEASSIPFA